MRRSKKAQRTDPFDEWHYPSGRMLDGITMPSGPTLTLYETMRLIFGPPGVFMTCIHRWSDWPVVKYISDRAVEMGKRLGTNMLIVPIEGSEEQFWTDTVTHIQETALRFHQEIDLDDTRVYWLVTSCDPRLLEEADRPFLLYDISELIGVEFKGFFSHLLDCFNQDGTSNDERLLAGKILLDHRQLIHQQLGIVQKGLSVLSDIALVFDRLSVQFCGFQWPIGNHIDDVSAQVRADEERYARITRIRESIMKLGSQDSASESKKDVTITVPEGKVSIFDQRGQNVRYQYNAAGDINFAAVQGRTDIIVELEKLRQEFPKAAQAGIIDAEVAKDAEDHLAKAVQQAKQPQADRETILERLKKAKTLIEGISAASGLVTALMTAIELIPKFF